MKNIACVTILLLSHNIILSQSKIEQSKSELKEPKTSAAASNGNSSSGSTASSSNSDDLSGIGDFFGFLFSAIGTVYYVAIGDYAEERDLNNNLTHYPYYNNTSGNYEEIDRDSIKKNPFRIDLEDNFLYSSSELYGNHLKAKIRPLQYFYFQTDFHQLYEFDRMDNTDHRLSLFQFNFCYDRIRFEKFNLGWTLGATYVGNDIKKAGFAYGLNAEYFMDNNISFLGSAKWSSVNASPVNTYELKGKYHHKNYFFTAGYEHLKIATPTYNFIALGGGIYF